MTKAMTCLVAFDLIWQGRLNEDTVFTVAPETARRMAGKGASLGLRAGERISVRELLYGVATASANDAAVVLAEGALGSEKAWITAMNARAQSLGMSGSHFASTNGVPDKGQTYVTAEDMARLGMALVAEHPDLYRAYIGRKTLVWRGQTYTSHNPLAGIFAGADGIKTGHTREAGFTFLGSVERDGRRLVLVIGRSPGETERAKAAARLAEWGYTNWESRPFLAPDWKLGSARVQNGAERQVALAVERNATLALPRGSATKVSARITYAGPLRAPIARGAQVAQLEILLDGRPSHHLPLVAMRSVAKAGPIDRVTNGLLGLFE